ncbi:MAG: winged helix DNA-binding protein [Vicinamibacterales bacterium]
MKAIERRKTQWHLGGTAKELAFAEFQHAVICLAEAFYRHAGKSLSMIAEDPNLSGYDSVILHVIHMGKRPKSITEIQHFTNRGDVSNIQYSMRKLLNAGLIKRAARPEGRSASYELTKKGIGIAARYVAARQELLSRFPVEEEQLIGRLKDGEDLMILLTGLYDQASRTLMTRV